MRQTLLYMNYQTTSTINYNVQFGYYATWDMALLNATDGNGTDAGNTLI